MPRSTSLLDAARCSVRPTADLSCVAECLRSDASISATTMVVHQAPAAIAFRDTDCQRSSALHRRRTPIFHNIVLQCAAHSHFKPGLSAYHPGTDCTRRSLRVPPEYRPITRAIVARVHIRHAYDRTFQRPPVYQRLCNTRCHRIPVGTGVP